jgi:Domain of unknown function (DUF4184)
MGCFVPDFPYFFFLKAHGFDGHTLRGMFLFDLPVGLLALWLFHRYVKQSSLIFLPDGIRRRLRTGAFNFLPPTRLAMIALSILIGSATHILWDSFTHSQYWPYRHWGFLHLIVPIPILKQLVMYKFLQYVSTVGGVVFVLVWVWHWYRTTAPVSHPIARPSTPAQRLAVVLILPVLAICGGIFRAHQKVVWLHGMKQLALFAADVAITAIAIIGLGLLACGIFLNARQADAESTSADLTET